MKGVMPGIVKELRTNENIRAKDVLVIGPAGERIGNFPLKQAITLAREKNLDLVEMASSSNPPVCRILDYGKYKYHQSKKEKEARKNQKVSLVREVRIRPKIGTHDLESKINTVKKLLGEGDKVKVQVIFRGREAAHPEIGKELLRKVSVAVKEDASPERPFVQEDRGMILLLTPALKSTKKSGKEVVDAKA